MSSNESSLFKASKLKLNAFTKTGKECQDALIELKPLIPILYKNDVKLIEFIFAPLWENKFFQKDGEETFICYSEILKELIAVDLSLWHRAIKYFSNLLLGQKDDSLKDDDKLTKNEQKLFPKIHYCIRSLCSSFINVKSNYLDLILNNIPLPKITTLHNFICYFYNCSSLYLFETDENREKILWKLINHLLDINSYFNGKKSLDSSFNDNLVVLFDSGLLIMFKFMNKICIKGNCDLEKTKNLNELKLYCNKDALLDFYKAISNIFFTSLIKIDYNTNVNLIILYICSLDEEICNNFIETLFTEAFLINNPKINTVNYFNSFLCSAKFINLETILIYLKKISKQVNDYLVINDSIEEDIENFYLLIKKHKYFYAMCNCLFNLICVKNEEFNENALIHLHQLQIQKIITSSLNPLAICPNKITKKFAEICKLYELGLCNMVLQKNKRIGLHDLLKKKDGKIKFNYPFENLTTSFDKLSWFYQT